MSDDIQPHPTRDNLSAFLRQLDAAALRATVAVAIRDNRPVNKAARDRLDLCWYECLSRGPEGEQLYRLALADVTAEEQAQRAANAQPLPWEGGGP